MKNIILIGLVAIAMLSTAADSRRYEMNVEHMTPEEILELADTTLASNEPLEAIKIYEQGISITYDKEVSLVTSLSLYTNLGTAYSSTGDERKAIEMYRQAILLFSNRIEDIVDESTKKAATDITAQAGFFLGMTHEELENYRKAADSYAFAASLDPYHWAALANLGAVLQDHLREPADALLVYNQAYDILIQTEVEPTDPPSEPKLVLSQLQYRIGLAITYSEKQKCVLKDDPTKEVPCSEIAANAFNNAIELDPSNENAKHMLAAVTVDATMRRASNDYVTQLFEDYAENFEHSLVEELGYTGYAALRKAFDQALGGVGKVPMFDVVVDAGCGTGLVGEQFRNISKTMIGVDLSPAIIQAAMKARPGLYDETEVGDVTQIFREKKPVSLIIAGDSYIYFGDLLPLFQSMEESLIDGGMAAFTLENVSDEFYEKLQETKPDWRWQLQPSGRFAHNKKYVDTVGQQCSLRVIHYEEMRGFRREGAKDVNGHIFVMQKVAHNGEL